MAAIAFVNFPSNALTSNSATCMRACSPVAKRDLRCRPIDGLRATGKRGVLRKRKQEHIVIFYVLLGALTLVFCGFTFAVWAKTRSTAFLVGAFFLYYWSLFGGWNLIHSLETGQDTPYLFYKL